ncbi:MAG TPA: hypothetical protein VKR53_00620 [Puia sp.]|nr:hypothetical protein [Puia sp.]
MKRLFLALILVAGTTALATNAHAQVYIGAHVGVRFPIHRAFIAPQVICPAPVPAPYYDDGVIVNAPVYGYGGYPVYNRYYGRGYHHYFNRGYYSERGRGYRRR